jgi:peptidoglycan hydrolase CwlO-like protein
MASLEAQITAQGDLIRSLKLDKTRDKAAVDAEVSKLNALKAQKAAADGTQPSASTSAKSKKSKNAIQLKVPKVRYYSVD